MGSPEGVSPSTSAIRIAPTRRTGEDVPLSRDPAYPESAQPPALRRCAEQIATLTYELVAGQQDAYDARGFYHRFAWAYDLIIEHPGGPQIEQVADTFRQRGVGAGSSLVDAGCGPGAYACELALRGFDVTAVDRSTELIAVATERAEQAGAHINFACADFTHDWCPAQLIDGVLCRGVLNDLLEDDERQLALTSFASWLRDDGLVLLDVRDHSASLQRYATGRRLERTARRGEELLTFTSMAVMHHDSDLLEVTERWVGTVGGHPVDHEDQFTMRTWTKECLALAAQAAGFRSLSWLDPGIIGARGDRLVAIASR